MNINSKSLIKIWFSLFLISLTLVITPQISQALQINKDMIKKEQIIKDNPLDQNAKQESKPSRKIQTGKTSYKVKQYDAAIENLTAVPLKMDIDGVVVFSVTGDLVNRGTTAITVSPEQLSLLPDMKEATIDFLVRTDQISQEIADILKNYGTQEGFRCGEEENTDCLLEPSEKKTFNFNQPSYLAASRGTLIAVMMDKKLTDADNQTVTDQNTPNNLKYVLLYPSSEDPDITVQGLSGVPQFDEQGDFTGVELTGYVINLSSNSFVKDYRNLVIKLNNKTLPSLDVTFDYSQAISEWKAAILTLVQDYPRVLAALEELFDNLSPDTLYPAGGKAYFSVTMSSAEFKNTNLISVTVPNNYQVLTIPSADSNNDGSVSLAEANSFLQALGGVRWLAGNDNNVNNNTAYLTLILNKPKSAIQVGDYLGTIWATISALLDELNWQPGSLLPDGWKPIIKIPDNWVPGTWVPDYCYKTKQGTEYCAVLDDIWTPQIVLTLLTDWGIVYEPGYIKSTLSSKVQKAIKKVQEFLKTKQNLPDLVSTGVNQVVKGGQGYDYKVTVFTLGDILKDFKVKLNIRGEKEMEQIVKGDLPLKFLQKDNLVFSSELPTLNPGGNMLGITLDSDEVITERNERNNLIFKEIIVDKDGQPMNYLKRYVRLQSDRQSNDFHYIAYPFVPGTALYDQGVLQKVQGQRWALNPDIHSSKKGKFKIAVKENSQAKDNLCLSNEVDFGDNEWPAYEIKDFAFANCDLNANKGQLVLFELSFKDPSKGAWEVMERRTIVVPREWIKNDGSDIEMENDVIE